MKVIAVIGSLNNDSFTYDIVLKLLKSVNEINSDISYNIISLHNVDSCNGCENCFKKGFCPKDSEDDMLHIRKQLLEADIIIFASPVYVHAVSGSMKTFIDRIASFCHTKNLAGKLGVVVATTKNSGEEHVLEYLKKVQTHTGIKVISDLKVYEKKELDINNIAINLNDKILSNYGFSSDSLELIFHQIRKDFIDYKSFGNDYDDYREKFWNMVEIKRIRSFQKFAIMRQNFTQCEEESLI